MQNTQRSQTIFGYLTITKAGGPLARDIHGCGDGHIAPLSLLYTEQNVIKTNGKGKYMKCNLKQNELTGSSSEPSPCPESVSVGKFVSGRRIVWF
ncbi:hypothetical protein HanXRQr2_Chr10g0458281 [Helianthus annuus]|uniref:Uncharacterized protein n=1 Tax=Helianthus annuus TaxID=4232 RepID=A0A9K3I179_HELAN|nr:hypothetical protein HanXRQr2_Chr10g0458281 [Helianthus annuus]